MIIGGHLHLVDHLPAILDATHRQILGDDGQKQLIEYLQAPALIFYGL